MFNSCIYFYICMLRKERMSMGIILSIANGGAWNDIIDFIKFIFGAGRSKETSVN